MAMSQDHKKALAQGRQEARSIKAYLKALNSKKAGRPITRASLENRLLGIDSKLEAETDPLKRLDLLQTRTDIESLIRNIENETNIEELAKGFVNHAKSYSERKGIGYSTWREAGVPAKILRSAGIPQSRRPSANG